MAINNLASLTIQWGLFLIPSGKTRDTFNLSTSFEKVYIPVATHSKGSTTTSAGDNGVVVIYRKSLSVIDLSIIKTASASMSSFVICVGV